MYTGVLKSKKQQLIEVESGLMLLSMIDYLTVIAWFSCSHSLIPGIMIALA